MQTPHGFHAGADDANDHGYLHSVETGAAADGPGIRFVYFMAGCLFRCLYCHNPDSWKIHNGRRVTLEEALAELAPYAPFLRMAGGVTISGGEPMMQGVFVGRLLQAIKERFSLHTALDTQGFLHADLADDWFESVDLVMLDLKHSNPDRYLALTGQPLQPSLDCAERLVRLRKRLWIRYVLVPGISDDPDDLRRSAAYIASLGSAVERVELLPFHQLGAHKWRDLGMTYALADTAPPSLAEIQSARGIFEAERLSVI